MGDAFEEAATFPRVLVVEDELLIRRQIVRVLRRFAVTTEAGSVREALALLQDSDPFDAIVCDVNLRDGLGWELLARVRSCSADTTITMISGDPRNAAHAVKLGAFLMKKPFDVGELVRSLQLPPALTHSTIPPSASDEDGSTTSRAS